MQCNEDRAKPRRGDQCLVPAVAADNASHALGDRTIQRGLQRSKRPGVRDRLERNLVVRRVTDLRRKHPMGVSRVPRFYL